MKATAGVKLSYRLQMLLYRSRPKTKGDEEEDLVVYLPGAVSSGASNPSFGAESNKPGEGSGEQQAMTDAQQMMLSQADMATLNSVALNNAVYQILRSNRQHRRNLLGNLLNYFNDALVVSESSLKSLGLLKADVASSASSMPLILGSLADSLHPTGSAATSDPEQQLELSAEVLLFKRFSAVRLF